VALPDDVDLAPFDVIEDGKPIASGILRRWSMSAQPCG